MKVLCIKTFKMSSGRIAFTKGKIYDFRKTQHSNGYYVTSDISTSHGMHSTHIDSEWFAKTKQIDEYIKKELFEI